MGCEAWELRWKERDVRSGRAWKGRTRGNSLGKALLEAARWKRRTSVDGM